MYFDFQLITNMLVIQIVAITQITVNHVQSMLIMLVQAHQLFTNLQANWLMKFIKVVHHLILETNSWIALV